METGSNTDRRRAAWHWVLFGVAIALTVTWLFLTPRGLLGKADAIGYAVCHQIDVRSFQINGRSFPLCARCSGLFLGALLGLIYQVIRGRKGRMPPLGASLFFGLLAFAWVFDGFNSFLMLVPSVSSLYTTQNWTRLVTGTGMGLAVSAILMPAFIQTMFHTWEDQSAFEGWKSILIVVLAAAGLDLVLLLENPWILYPLALLSAGGVLALLIMVYSTVLVMLFKRDNTYQDFRALLIPLVGGYMLALLQIGAIDLVRYLLTGTWGGFSL
jgi:uncharacterized membrane protein